MGLHYTGQYPDNRRDRPTLSLNRSERSPQSSLLVGVEHFFNTDELSEAQRWGEALWAARNTWDVARRQKGGAR